MRSIYRKLRLLVASGAALTLAGTVGCSASSAATAVDAGTDAGESDAASEAGTGGCTITTCSGPVLVSAGGTVSMGDNCNTSCTCNCGGGFCAGGCSVSADCGYCGDGG
jgi:hypothetical protein